MAVTQKHTVYVFGIELNFPNAYFEVFSVSGDKNEIVFTVKIYDSAEKKNEIGSIVYTFQASVDDDSYNVFKQAYEYLKTLPEYENAIDC